MTERITVSNPDELRYATATPGNYPEYEARISPDGTTALLLAHADNDDRPDVDWHDRNWARDRTSTWDSDLHV